MNVEIFSEKKNMMIIAITSQVPADDNHWKV